MYFCLQCSSETKNPKFCNKSCAARFNNRGKNRHGTILRKCENCQKALTRSNQRCCSQKCTQHLRAKTRIREGTASGLVIRNNLIREKGARCMECGWDKINTKTGKCPIQMDHIDGNHLNNSLENLRLLCPNCHSLTPTFGSLNMGNGRKSRRKK